MENLNDMSIEEMAKAYMVIRINEFEKGTADKAASEKAAADAAAQKAENDQITNEIKRWIK